MNSNRSSLETSGSYPDHGIDTRFLGMPACCLLTWSLLPHLASCQWPVHYHQPNSVCPRTLWLILLVDILLLSCATQSAPGQQRECLPPMHKTEFPFWQWNKNKTKPFVPFFRSLFLSLPQICNPCPFPLHQNLRIYFLSLYSFLFFKTVYERGFFDSSTGKCGVRQYLEVVPTSLWARFFPCFPVEVKVMRRDTIVTSPRTLFTKTTVAPVAESSAHIAHAGGGGVPEPPEPRV